MIKYNMVDKRQDNNGGAKMNYERTVLEMMERIKSLEEKVTTLEKCYHEMDKLDDEEVDVMTQESKESGRTSSRNEIMNILRDQYGFSVRKGNQSEGSGIVISKNGKSYNVKVSFSSSYFDYVPENVICSGWHTLYEKIINNPLLPFFIFVVADAEKKFHYFIFKREDIKKVFQHKVPDSTGKLHFYFRVREDGMPVELRDKIEKNMSPYYNNWSIFENIK
jgi:hypothetical protein